MRSLVLTLVIFSTVPFILSKPHFGVLVYSWLGYMNLHRLTWGISQVIPFSLIVALVTLGAWFFSREPKKIPITALSAFMLLFTIWICITTLFAVMPAEAYVKWDRTFKILAMSFVTIALINNRERLDALVWVIVVSLGFWGVRGGLFTILTGGNYRVWGPESTFIADNNGLALALVMILPLVRYLQLQSTRMFIRLGLLAAMSLCFLSILGSHSRGAAVATGGMLIVLVLRSRQRVLFGLLLLAGGATALTFMPAKYYERMATIENYEEDESANSRLSTWQFTYDFALSSPIIGGGFSMFESEELRDEFAPGKNVLNAHSIWFEVLGEHGFTGLFLFLIIGAVALLACGRIRRTTRSIPHLSWAFDLASMLQVALVGYAIGGTFLNKAFFDLYWQFAAIVVSLSVVVRRTVETENSLYQHKRKHQQITANKELLNDVNT